KELKNRADKIVGQNVVSAVIGRPVEYVGGNNRQALERMIKACKIEGFENVTFEYEPIGAAYDYGVNIKESQKVLVFDFGGGTLDISILKFPEKEVLINVGLPIGGDHFNSEIFMNKLSKYFGSEATYGLSNLKLPKYIFSSLQNWYEISLLKSTTFANNIQHFRYKCSDTKSLDRLNSLVTNNLGFNMYEEIERIKKGLTINDEELYKFHSRDINIETLVKKAEFEEIIESDLKDIKNLIENAIKSAKITLDEIDIVATTGGSSLVPSVQRLLVGMFGKNKIKKSDAFTGVASGLAIMANNIN
ncbi:MAG: Hsp70 family protein, partial [bacterium]|nr:Hsp70 family protein [bacterium]